MTIGIKDDEILDSLYNELSSCRVSSMDRRQSQGDTGRHLVQFYSYVPMIRTICLFDDLFFVESEG